MTRARGTHAATSVRWGTGCAFLDYDRDGRLDLFAANYIDFDLRVDAAALVRPVPIQGSRRSPAARRDCRGARTCSIATAATARSPTCRSRPASLARAAPTGSASRRSTSTTTAGSTSTSPTTRIRARSTATTTTARSPTSRTAAGCAYSQDGKPQAGMGLAIGDYDRNGTMDIFKTNFAGDTSTLYANTGKGTCEDRTFAERLRPQHAVARAGASASSISTATAGSICSSSTATSIPRSRQLKTEAGYEQRKVVYRNLRNGKFADVSEQLGAPVTTPKAGRGAAFADFDNDGDVDVIVNNLHDTPDLFPARSVRRAQLDHAEARGHAVEPQRHRRARARRHRRRRAAAGSQGRGQLLFPERFARCISASVRAARSIGSSCAGRMAWKKRWTNLAINRAHTLTEGKGGDTQR